MHMPIATIIDIIGSKRMPSDERKRIIDIVDMVIKSVNKLEKHSIKSALMAYPAITGGDSLEILAKKSEPILYILHQLLMRDIPIRLGIGIGKIDILKRSADECDGPAFWAARQALEEGQKNKANAWVIAHESSELWEALEAKSLGLVFLLLERMSLEQRRYCFYYIWEDMKLKEIAKKEGVSVSNVSQIVKKTNCRSLKHLIFGFKIMK